MAVDKTRHSRLGIASFLIGVGSFIYSVVLVLTSVWIVNSRDSSEHEYQFSIFTAYYVFFVAPATHLVGLILGICGCLQNKRKKILATIGIAINLLFLVMHFGIRGYFSGAFR